MSKQLGPLMALPMQPVLRALLAEPGPSAAVLAVEMVIGG
jgi:hypothetical protein